MQKSLIKTAAKKTFGILQTCSQTRIVLLTVMIYGIVSYSFSTESLFLPDATGTLRQEARRQAQETVWKDISIYDPTVGNLATVSCPTFLRNGLKSQEAFVDPNNGFYHTPVAKTSRPFKVSVNVAAHHRWGLPLTWTTGEPREYRSDNNLLETQIQSILYQAPTGSHVLHMVNSENTFDQSYYYTLLARSLASNLRVDAFFHNSCLLQILRLCESLHFNKWTRDGYLRVHPLWKSIGGTKTSKVAGK